jgi:ABC-2 type transport system ATP-binding protein
MTAAIEVEHLTKSYGPLETLHGVSFAVEKGEVFGLLGTNGAGKTTTIEILEGYRPRSSGTVSVLGSDPQHADRAWRNRIGLVLQESELDPVHTVHETLSMFARYFDRPLGVSEAIAAVGLEHKAMDRVGHLSGGEKRRVDVALGLIGDPEVLFLDEPTTGLDPSARRDIWAMVERLRDSGTTILLTTHYMDEAAHLADRILILRSGSIAAEGSADELVAQLGEESTVRFRVEGALPPGEIERLVGRDVEHRGAGVSFRSSNSVDELSRILGAAEHGGWRILDLEVVRPSLDDVFVALAGGGESEGPRS